MPKIVEIFGFYSTVLYFDIVLNCIAVHQYWNGGVFLPDTTLSCAGAIHNDPALPSHIPWWSHLMVAHSCSPVIMCIGSEVTFYLQHFPNWTFVLCHSFACCEICWHKNISFEGVFVAQICSENFKNKFDICKSEHSSPVFTREHSKWRVP